MNNVLAVIVTFNPNILRLKNLIDSLYRQNVNILIVDNFSSNKEDLEFFSSQGQIVFLEKNFGIAYAQNVGINQAISNDSKFLLFFDQDSNIPSDFVGLMLETYFEVESENVCCISPRFYNDIYNFYYDSLIIKKTGIRRRINLGEISKPEQVSLVISSGSLVPISAIKKIGLMKDSFFIDAVDTEWCFRALSKGFKIYVSHKAIMKHTIGDQVLDLKLKKLSIHSPFRRYFIIRNNFYLFKLSYVPKIFAIRDITVSIIIQFIFIIFLSASRKENFRALYKAIRDGVIQSRNYHG